MKFFERKTIGDNYLTRWHVFPRNPFFNIMIHRFSGDDKSAELHDHPWPFLSILLRGNLIEDYRTKSGMIATRKLPRFIPRYYPAKHRHRLEVWDHHPGAGNVWTVVFTGPKIRLWGFYSKRGVLKRLMDGDDVVFNLDEHYGEEIEG